MENRNSKIGMIVLISMIVLITGCGITINRNQYYGYPDQGGKPLMKKNQNHLQTDTLNNIGNG